MSTLDLLLPAPRLAEVDTLDLAAPPDEVWQRVRHGDLGASPLVRALFAIRTAPDRLRPKSHPPPVAAGLGGVGVIAAALATLENFAGCDLRSAESIHPDWSIVAGDLLRLHPAAPPLPIVACDPGRYFLAHAGRDPSTAEHGGPWVEATWLFFLEPLGPRRCRLVSRYRCATSDDLETVLKYGPTLMEPIGFAMDRGMLRGIKDRCERTASAS
jgi:hypothetical protein